MSVSRHLVLVACAQALILSCASRSELLRAQPMMTEAAHSGFEFGMRGDEPRAVEPRASKPYAPTRAPNTALYTWQSEKRSECETASEQEQPDAERSPDVRSARSLLAAIPERASIPTGSARAVSPDLVVAGLRPALHLCFSHWLADQLDAQGSVRFALELGCAGEVEAISAENQGVDESTLACLFSAVGPARFAPPAAGRATVLVPVMLKNAR